MKKFLFIALLFCACTENKPDVEIKQSAQSAGDYAGIFTPSYGLDLYFHKINLPYWWSEKYIDSLGIKRIVIQSYDQVDMLEGVDYSQAIPQKKFIFNFQKGGKLRVMHIQEYYDEKLISTKEYKFAKADIVGWVAVEQKMFSKFKKRFFYDPTLENELSPYLEKLEKHEGIYVYKGKRKSVLINNGDADKLSYCLDSLNKSKVYNSIGKLPHPERIVRYEGNKIDTLFNADYSDSNVLLSLTDYEHGMVNKRNFIYSKTQLKSIEDSLFIEGSFVSSERHQYYYDSLGLPFQLVIQEALKNGAPKPRLVQTFSFEM